MASVSYLSSAQNAPPRDPTSSSNTAVIQQLSCFYSSDSSSARRLSATAAAYLLRPFRQGNPVQDLVLEVGEAVFSPRLGMLLVFHDINHKTAEDNYVTGWPAKKNAIEMRKEQARRRSFSF